MKKELQMFHASSINIIDCGTSNHSNIIILRFQMSRVISWTNEHENPLLKFFISQKLPASYTQ